MDTAHTLSNLWPKIEMRLPKLVNILLIVLIAITLAKLVWSFFESDDYIADLVIPTTSVNNTKPVPRPDYDRKIAQLSMFGKAAPVISKNVDEAPDTTLNLELLGVLAGDEEYGYAIVSSGANKIKHYALGDDISNGTTLHAVFADRIILDRGTKMETLRLPKAKKVSGVSKKKAKKAAPQQQSIDGGKNDFDSLGEFREEIMSNPVRLTEFINAEPESDAETGEFKGYSLTPSRNPDMFYQLGFQPGDVLTSVNGILIDSPNKGPEALQTLKDASEVTLVVMREGTEITLFNDLSQ